MAENASRMIKNALENPIYSPRLSQTKAEKAVIICDDITRPTRADLILPHILEELRHAPEKRLIFALGSHRPMTDEEIDRKIGPIHEIEVINGLGEMADYGEFQISRVVGEADLVIGIGNITPHPVSGWGGGATCLFPGVSGVETWKKFHALQGVPNENFWGVDNSPVRLMFERWARSFNLFIVNTVMHRGEIRGVFAGHYHAAHREGVKLARKVLGRRLDKLYDTVVINSYPADLDFWQATKGYTCGDAACKEGGMIVLVTPCPEGVGPHKHYLEYIGTDDVEALPCAPTEDAEFAVKNVGARLAKMRRMKRLGIVTDGLTRDQTRLAQIHHFSTIEEAIHGDVLHVDSLEYAFYPGDSN